VFKRGQSIARCALDNRLGVRLRRQEKQDDLLPELR
jgi:hypothetical protein